VWPIGQRGKGVFLNIYRWLKWNKKMPPSGGIHNCTINISFIRT
jgi:hypothetical protein